MMKALNRTTLLSLSIAALTACGGGGGGSDDNSNRNNNAGTNDALALFEEGIYEYSLSYTPGATQQDLIELTRYRLQAQNGELVITEDILDNDTWLPAEQYYNDDDSEESPDLILTASGWKYLTENNCTIAADANASNAVLLTCQASVRRHVFTESTLADQLVSSFLEKIADNDFNDREPNNSDGASYDEAVNATKDLSALFSSSARQHQSVATQQTPELRVLDCAPPAPGKPAEVPVAEWVCTSSFDSSTWAEMEASDETFPMQYADQNGEYDSANVRLDGDLSDGSSGNIVVVSDFSPYGETATPPGTVLGTWEKISLHGQTFIKLLESPYFAHGFEALTIINGQIVEAGYEPPGTTSNWLSVNAAAASTIDAAVIGIFPIHFFAFPR